LVILLGVFLIAGCEAQPGQDPAAPQAPSAENVAVPPDTAQSESMAKAQQDTYAPDGLEGATVTIRPLGKAAISAIAGYPVRIHEDGSDGAYREAKLKPGDYILHVGNTEAPQGLNLQFHGEPGNYFALSLTYSRDGGVFWTPVIVKVAPNGQIVADKDGMLVGKSQTEAAKLLSAGAGQAAATVQPAKTEAPSNPADQEAQRKQLEAKAKGLFDEGAKALEAGKMDDALQALDEALMIAPQFDSALALRGVVLARLKKPKEALDSLDEAIRIGRDTRGENDDWLHWPLMEKGLILIAIRQPKAGYEALSESIRLRPTPKALFARASLSFAQGQALGNKDDWDGAQPFFKSAQADADKGIEMVPDSVKFWSLKTGTHIMLNEHEQACSAMRKACDLGNCSILEQYPQCKQDGS
jgi:tetratricopeptide (TPR) repeat protein